MGALKETSQPLELLLSVDRDGGSTLGAQIEDQLRGAVRDGTLRPGAQLPSTRDLARQLAVSRRIVVDAYAQLAAEGYLMLRQGARPEVAATAGAGGGEGDGAVDRVGASAPLAPVVAPRFDFRPSVPDCSAFPRTAWLRSVRTALSSISDDELTYSDLSGTVVLRSTLAEYLGRVRGVVAEPGRVVITCGYTQALDVFFHTLAARGARRIAFEDPSDLEGVWSAQRSGLEPVAVPVDEHGIVVDELVSSGADGVVLTPAHQHPLGVVLSSERRAALVDWLRSTGAFAIEDDYDAEFRYDRAAVGALQGLDPEHVVYAGSASKVLAPALRLGWMVVPPSLLDDLMFQKQLADRGTSRIDQVALADFIGRGELDRHLRRMRSSYRRRRDVLVAALTESLPSANMRGIAAGLHATVELPGGPPEKAILAEARARRIFLAGMSEQWIDKAVGPPTLLLGFAHVPEAAIPAGVRELAAAVEAAAS